MLGRAWGVLRNTAHGRGAERAYGEGMAAMAGSVGQDAGRMDMLSAAGTGIGRGFSSLNREIGGGAMAGYGGAVAGGVGGFATGEGLTDRIGRGVMGAGLGAGAGVGGYAGRRGIMGAGGYQQFGKSMYSKARGGMTKMGGFCTLRSNKG
jgi:hypothetical protein